MTTKFSQDSDVQTLPPVCHPIIILPPPWLPPAYPDLRGYLKYDLTHPIDGDHSQFKSITLPWIPADNFWWYAWVVDGWGTKVMITPAGPDAPMLIMIRVDPPNLPFWMDDWNAPPYTPQQPWESGQHTFRWTPEPSWLWSTFST